MQPTKGFASGSITTQNLNPNSGVPTAGSFVMLPLTADYDTIAFQVVGTYTGVLSLQATVDGLNWITFGGVQAITNLNTAAQSSSIPSATQGAFQSDVASFQACRLTALGAQTGTAVCSMAGSNSNGITGIDTPLALATGSTVALTPNTAAQAINVLSAAGTNATAAKAAAGSLYALTATNYTATVKFVKLYNKATAPVVGTDVPVATIEVAANACRQMEFGALGKRFTAGIAYAITGLQPIADVTAVAAGDVQLHGTFI